MNTLLKDEELDEARAIITRLYESSIDGVIIQDLGLLHAGLPPVPLIASTQTDNRTPEKVLFF
ncbi:MAG: hypothetical protein HC906_00565 [Bacteroidales bacterium]|nr:hypothetical protein [Bacteroidales bacterium]